MSQISVISKLTGVGTTTEGTQVTLSHSSIVELKVERANVADFARNGNDLVITLHSGEVITVKNFFVTDAQGASQLVLQDSEGALWWIQDPAGAATYESIASTDVLLAASGSDAGGAAIWPWVLGGIVAAGGIAAAASTGGGGGGDDDDDNGSNPGTPTNPSDPDTTPPNAPSGLQFSPDGKTVSGTAEPGSTITLKDADGNVIGTGKTGSDGKFTIDLGTPLTNGEQITATATDSSGNTSPGTTITAPDTTAPDAPDILLVNDDAGDKAGPLENGQRTDDARPTFSGIGEPGSTITLYDNGKQIGTTTVDAKGSWSFTPTTDLANGSHTITTTATDAAGNTSPASAAVSFVVDTVAPGAPAISSATDDIDPGKGTVSSGGSTNDPRPQLSGTAEPGSTVTIYDGSVAIGTAVTGSNGTWTFTPSVNLGESTHQFTVRATDAAGNTGPASPVFTLTVDLTPPATPTAIVLSDETGAIKGAITAGQFTDSSEPLLAGRGEPGGTIQVYDNGVLIGQTTVLPNGTWSLRPDNPLAEGPHSITIKQTDAAGNQSAESQPVNFTVDTTPPALPVIAINPVGTQVTGTAEPGSKIVITNSNGDVIGRATTDGNGNFVATLSPAQTNGEQLSVVATDAAGNQSPAASLTAPDTTPDILSVVDDQPGVTGPISQNGITNDRTPTLNGTAEPGSTITIHSGGDVLGTVVVPSSGQWTFTPSTPLAEGAHVLTATSSNGNVSNAWTITIDGTAPDAPAITQLVDNVPGGTGPVGANDTTNDATPTLNGTGEPGSTITIRLDGVDIGTAVVGSSGAWTFTPTTPVGDGTHTLTAIATDVAGNTSPVSGGFTFTVDTTPPPVATLATVTDDAGDVKGPLSSGDTTDDTQPLLQGSAPDGTVITVYDGTTLLGTATLDGSGGWSFTPTTPLTDGPHSLTIHATDAAGNTSISDPFELVMRDLRPYSWVMLAALFINVLSLSGIVFSMQVYDRVIPAQSYPTLYVLTIGVLIATLFGFVLRVARGHIMDLLGKRSDLRVSDRVFGHALRLRNSAIPRSTGSFISQLRELEQIREMVTSSTISTIVDLPFFLLFVVVLAIIAPQLAWIAPVAAVIMVLPGLLLQKKLAELAKQSAHESTLRNAVLVESVQGLEDIKLMQAENRFLQQWNSYIQITAESGLRTRELTQNLISWGMTIQSLVYAAVIVVGAPMVIDGTLTTGSVVAASMLASRMIAPMATLCGVLARWQQVKAAKEGLDSIMQLPTENQREETPIRQDVLRGHYLFEQAQFRYHPEDPRMALRINRLEIKPGEKVAILGRNGAGKSTLLQAMAGGIDLAGGELRLDNLSLPHLDVADVRRNVGFMTQNARLFYGTLRENITLGMPRATDEEIFAALELTGAASFVQKLPKGLDYPIMENGVGLSGGQRQSILLARMLLRDPNIVLMDEPTASLDEHTEREFIQRLSAWLGHRTLIVATHRVPVLELVERVVVLKEGMLVMDAPKAQALNNSRMQQQQAAAAREWKNENQSA
ncbi:type I secretion system permease/ATPase [Enterobacter cloacae]|uniref:type I secretion system permease/ATPase n=1 Tax=Enterobacter cloacae TaxID=550 RepID=UPI002877F35D|nr:type I secretion system permease/ATPase [Enterobacter cloacae]